MKLQLHLYTELMPKGKEREGAILVIDGSSSQHHGVVIGPFGSVAPAFFVAIPEVAAGWIANNAVWKTLPYGKSKVHLDD